MGAKLVVPVVKLANGLTAFVSVGTGKPSLGRLDLGLNSGGEICSMVVWGTKLWILSIVENWMGVIGLNSWELFVVNGFYN